MAIDNMRSNTLLLALQRSFPQGIEWQTDFGSLVGWHGPIFRVYPLGYCAYLTHRLQDRIYFYYVDLSDVTVMMSEHNLLNSLVEIVNASLVKFQAHLAHFVYGA